jgi:hypothetical protein
MRLGNRRVIGAGGRNADRTNVMQAPAAVHRRPRSFCQSIVSGTARICPRISPPGFFGVWTFT